MHNSGRVLSVVALDLLMGLESRVYSGGRLKIVEVRRRFLIGAIYFVAGAVGFVRGDVIV